MNKEQTQKVNMIDGSMAVLNNAGNKPVWVSNAVFNGAVGNIAGNMSVLNGADTMRLSGPGPFTETKGQAKVNLIAATMLHAAAGKGYAASVGNMALKTTCDISETTLVKSTDADLGNWCRTIYAAVLPFAGSMAAWSVTATTLSNLDGDINLFMGLVGTPVGQISIQNSASAAIDAQIAVIYGILNDTIDTLMVQFKVSHEIFYNAYFSAREVHHTGVRHSTTFEGFIYKTGGTALEHAQVALTLAGDELRKHFTDEGGHFRFTRLHLGDFTLTVSAPGYITQSKVFNITTLQGVEADFTLVAAGSGGNSVSVEPVGSNE